VFAFPASRGVRVLITRARLASGASRPGILGSGASVNLKRFTLADEGPRPHPWPPNGRGRESLRICAPRSLRARRRSAGRAFLASRCARPASRGISTPSLRAVATG